MVAIPLPAITADGVRSGVIQFGEAAGAATPQPVRLEFSINKCPGVFESPKPGAPSGEFCSVDSTNGTYNQLTWFAKPFSTIQNIQTASAYGYCWAGDADKKYYLNARWTYSSCAFGYPTCGFAIQQNQGPY